MNNKMKIRSITAKVLVVIMIVTLLPGNVLAEIQEIGNERQEGYPLATPSQAEQRGDKSEDYRGARDTRIRWRSATPSEATPSEATPSEATPSEATPSEATPSEATPSEATPVPFEEVYLDGRRFSMITSVGEAPYYQVLKYTVPEGEGGHYTFYSEELSEDYYYEVDPYGYLCTSEQYEALCHRIESAQKSVWSTTGSQCLAYDDDGGMQRNFLITYGLEEGQDYYFIATRWRVSSSDDKFKIVVMRDIEINLANQDADVPGTSKLYSSGSYWSEYSDRYHYTICIWPPYKRGYKFGGYFTEKGGKGTKVIDLDGYILDELNDLSSNDTIYSYWEELPRFKNERFKDGIVNTAYSAKLEINSNLSFVWLKYGELPAGLTLDRKTGVISGVPTETGTSSFWIVATNYENDVKCKAETSITINSEYDSSEHENQVGRWHFSSDGRWRYYTSGDRYYSNEWKQVEYNGELGWYYFGKDGYIVVGWFADKDGRWYYLNPISDGTKGKMKTGWITDPQDGNCYYLDPSTGRMVTGWVCIDEVWYYFNEIGVENSGWKWAEETDQWIYESLGKQTLGMLDQAKTSKDMKED